MGDFGEPHRDWSCQLSCLLYFINLPPDFLFWELQYEFSQLSNQFHLISSPSLIRRKFFVKPSSS
jgi:hypothetical protein